MIIIYLKIETGNSVNKIDLVNQSLASDLESRQFLNGIIYNDYEYESGKTLEDFKTKFHITPNTDKPLYDYLTELEVSCNIREELGTYYIEDLASDPSNTSRDPTKEKIEEVNKSEKRVITYIFETK